LLGLPAFRCLGGGGPAQLPKWANYDCRTQLFQNLTFLERLLFDPAKFLLPSLQGTSSTTTAPHRRQSEDEESPPVSITRNEACVWIYSRGAASLQERKRGAASCRAVTSVHPDIFKDAREARKICQQPLAQQRILDLGLQYACVWSDLQQQRGLSLRQDAD
jgi:hypothetical protein